MKQKQLIKIVLLNAGLVIINVAAFSKGLLGLSVDKTDALGSALAITIPLVSVLVFCYGNYRLISSLYQKAPFVLDELDEPGEFLEALKCFRSREVFAEYVKRMEDQIDRLLRKKQSFRAVLYQRFQEEAQEFQSLDRLVAESEELLFENMKKLLSRMSIFDEKEYGRLQGEQDRSDAYDARMRLYKEHFLYLEKYTGENEQILLQLDKLLVEISRMGDMAGEENGLETLRDTISAMRRLHEPGGDEMEELEKKYENR